jgi:hypothetical protein
MERSTNVMQRFVECRGMLKCLPICRNGNRVANSTRPPLYLAASRHLLQNLTILALLCR